MSGTQGAKRYKGQIQIHEGGPTGEPVIISRLDYTNTCGQVKYYGEAKVGSREDQYKWHIELFEYDSLFNVSSIKTATNKMTTKASSVSVDTSSNPGFTKITIFGGTFFEEIASLRVRDRITLDTPSNKFNRVYIEQILSATEVLILDVIPTVDEVGTAIDDEDLTLTLENEDTKEFPKRRWDLREFYIYE